MSFAEFISIIALGIQGVLVYLAWKTIQENNGSAKKRAIVDLIIKQREDLALREASSIIYELNRQDDGFIKLFDEPDRMQKVLYALDSLEFVAVGIRLGAFDEGVYKDLQCSKVRNTWKAASGFIETREETCGFSRERNRASRAGARKQNTCFLGCCYTDHFANTTNM